MKKKKNNVILLINHRADELRQFGALLQDAGDVIFATSAKSALFLAQQRKPDLIICDLELEGTSGIDLCRQLKTQKCTKDCTVIVAAAPGASHCDAELAALQAGAVDFVTKPTEQHPRSTDVILARIRTHLTLSRHKNLLQVLADKDGLTEVYNRRYFENQARTELKRHYRQQQALTLALLDIDHFKAFNDAYGHLQGDTCLREVAQAIGSGSRRPGEFVARYGGEEFAVVLPNTNAANARKYGQWICAQVLSLAIPHAYSDTLPFVTISAGIATVVPSANTTLEHLINTADSALYLAKESGRNQFKVATIEHETIQEAG